MPSLAANKLEGNIKASQSLISYLFGSRNFGSDSEKNMVKRLCLVLDRWTSSKKRIDKKEISQPNKAMHSTKDLLCPSFVAETVIMPANASLLGKMLNKICHLTKSLMQGESENLIDIYNIVQCTTKAD
eukprot:scaffold247508_cov19-Prasinocladus_malaysianus.AAC.1